MKKNNTLEFVRLPALVPFFVYFDDEQFVSRCEAQEQWSSLPKDSQQHEISRTPVRWWHASSGNKNPKMRTNIWDISRKSQSITTYCNAKLNRDKCVCVTFNRNNQITFADEQLLESVDETIYLGTQINKRVDPKTEISQTMPIVKKLDLFWNKPVCQTSGKFKRSMQYVFQNSCAKQKHFSPQRLRQLKWTRFNWNV